MYLQYPRRTTKTADLRNESRTRNLPNASHECQSLKLRRYITDELHQILMRTNIENKSDSKRFYLTLHLHYKCMKTAANQNEALVRILHNVIHQKEWLKYKWLSKHSRRFKAIYMIFSKCTWNFEPLKLIRVVGIRVVLWWGNCSTRVRNRGVKTAHPEHCSY
jgi:hypothetical protein